MPLDLVVAARAEQCLVQEGGLLRRVTPPLRLAVMPLDAVVAARAEQCLVHEGGLLRRVTPPLRLAVMPLDAVVAARAEQCLVHEGGLLKRVTRTLMAEVRRGDLLKAGINKFGQVCAPRIVTILCGGVSASAKPRIALRGFPAYSPDYVNDITAALTGPSPTGTSVNSGVGMRRRFGSWFNSE